MREPFAPLPGEGDVLIRRDDANAAIAQDKAFHDAKLEELSSYAKSVMEDVKQIDALKQENERLIEDNAALKGAVNFKSAQTPNIMLACLRGLRAQLAEQATACESLQAKLVEATEIIAATDYSHFHGHKDDLEKCPLCAVRNKANNLLAKLKGA